MFQENELKTEHLGMNALNFASKHNSASRAYMFTAHYSQRLVMDNMEETIIQTGVDKEFSKYTFSVKMPENGRIVKIIDRYPSGIGKDSLPFNPETLIIYENEDTKEIDYFSIPYYASFHQFFGYKYNFNNDNINKLKPGAYIPKDTIFADSPGVTENGGYQYGNNLNVALMSMPACSEDGMLISRDVLDRLKFRVYETRVVEFGAKTFPLNLFGCKDVYKPFKDIGETIDGDGLLMMLREYNDDLSPIEMSVFDTMEPDYLFDKGFYARGGTGKIIDIKVTSNNTKSKQMPEEMSEHVEKYRKALLKFHHEVIATEERLRMERRKKFGENTLRMSPKFHRLVVESLAMIDHNSAKMKQNLNLLYRKDPIDEYRVEFIIEYVITPNMGFKLTDRHGGKGTICAIAEPHEMPVDQDGNRADLVIDDTSTISRMNIGRLHEMFLTSVLRDVRKEVMRRLNVAEGTKVRPSQFPMSDGYVRSVYDFLTGLYKILNDCQHNFFTNEITEDEKSEHLADIINDKIYSYYPIENDRDSIELIGELEAYHRPTYGPVSYIGNSGERCVTDIPVNISPMYMMLLDKIADDWSAISSGKLHHFGVLAPINKSEKFSHPYRNTPVKNIGETEGRIFAGYCGKEAIAEMMDRANNPTTQRNTVWNILNADKPGNIDNVVDRDFIKLGGSKPLQLVKHLMFCTGFLPTYEKED